MHIRTAEEDYDYRMKRIVKKFVKDNELFDLSGDELFQEIWENYVEEFGRAVMEDMEQYAGDELFEAD